MRFVLALAVSAAATLAQAGHDGPVSVDGYRVAMVAVPAEMIEPPIHGGAPAGTDSHHVIVIIKDPGGRALADARVAARVRDAGFPGPLKPLAPMTVGATPAYGNFFPLHGAGPYRVEVEFQPSGNAIARRAEFDYEHRGWR